MTTLNTTSTTQADAAPFTSLRGARCLSADAWAFALDAELDRSDWEPVTTWDDAGLYGRRVFG
jgi:hypothetical protein